MALVIEIVENVDASGFKLYDLTPYPGGFNPGMLSEVSLSVNYKDEIYHYVPSTLSMLMDMGVGPGYLNMCGNALNSYFTITPDRLYNGSRQLNSTYFPDGYYEITVTAVYGGITETDYSHQGFLAENYMMASKLPLLIDIENFDYEENRLHFLCIAMLRASTWAAELGRQKEFEDLTNKVNDFLDARSINEIWST